MKTKDTLKTWLCIIGMLALYLFASTLDMDEALQQEEIQNAK